MDIFAPVQWLTDWLLFSLFSLDKNSHVAGGISFFIYDSIKIIILLIAINYVMAIIRHYLSLEKIRDFLASRKWYGFDYFLAAFLGLVTPFCSCSSIPLFIGFLGVGIPLGVTLTFLIASPLLSETAIILLWGVFGFKVMAIYILSGMAISMVGGFMLRNVNQEKHISPTVLAMSKNVKKIDTKTKKFKKSFLSDWWRQGWTLSKAIIPYILIGVGVGALIHNVIPANFFANTLGDNSWWSVPVATIISVPLYANAVGVVPIIEALVSKGVAIGTALTVLMATIGLSLPEALILKKVMSFKLLAAFFAVVTIGIMIIGWTLNILL